MAHDKTLRELMRITGRGPGPMQVAAIDLSASTSDADLVAAAAGRRIYVEQLDLMPAASSTIEIWSGPSGSTTRPTGGPGSIAGNGGSQYVLGPFYTTADGAALVVDRGTSVALAGTVRYCYV